MKVGLFRGKDLISLKETDEDGRIANLFDAEFAPGEYRLVFYVEGGFFEKVELTLAFVEDRHYHVPLLVSSYACATYRGS
ncbi:MAG TPA: hydroxyisourate hydrolase [Gaiellaceae bacterium]